MPGLTPEERATRSRLGAHASWGKTADRSARTAPARAALEARFLEEAGGDPVRAEHLRKAYFARLSLKSAVSRRKARELTEAAEEAEAELRCTCDDGAYADQPPCPVAEADVAAGRVVELFPGESPADALRRAQDG